MSKKLYIYLEENILNFIFIYRRAAFGQMESDPVEKSYSPRFVRLDSLEGACFTQKMPHQQPHESLMEDVGLKQPPTKAEKRWFGNYNSYNVQNGHRSESEYVFLGPIPQSTRPLSSLVVGDEGCIGPSRKLLCLSTQKNMQHMHGIIPFMFDFWAKSVVHLLSMPSAKELHDQTNKYCSPCEFIMCLKSLNYC